MGQLMDLQWSLFAYRTAYIRSFLDPATGRSDALGYPLSGGGVRDSIECSIGRAHLPQLLDVLNNSDVAMEASVSNLWRLLQSLCATSSSNALALGNETTGEALPDGCNEGAENWKGFHVNNEETDQTSNSSEDDSDSEILPEFENHGFNFGGKACPFGNKDDLTKNLSSDEPVKLFNDQCLITTELEDFDVDDDLDLDDEWDIDMLATELVDSDRPKLPSVEEILESWKESRKNDGTSLQFQFSTK